MDLNGKTAVITGASSGIGAATAELLHGKGVKLVLSGQREDKLAAVAERCGGARVVVGDIAAPETPGLLLDAALAAHGGCDIVLNNAGTMALVGPIPEIDIDAMCHMMRVNVEAAFRMAYVALKHFVAQGSGHLVNTSSVLGTKVRPNSGAYAASKYAVEALSESLRQEVAGTDVRVSAVEPGLVFSDMHRDFPVHPVKQRGLKAPLMPIDVARCILFILEQPAHVAVPRLMVLPSEDPI